MKNNAYLTELKKIIHDLNNSLDQDDHQKFLLLCAALHEFRKENAKHDIEKIDDKVEIENILPHIDTLIDRMESNKKVLAKKIFTLRKSIQISKNQGESEQH